MKDKSELIDEVLLKVLLNHPNIQPSDKAFLTLPKVIEAKATLQKAFREVEIEGRVKALTDLDNLNLLNDSDAWHKFYLAEVAELIKIREDGEHNA